MLHPLRHQKANKGNRLCIDVSFRVNTIICSQKHFTQLLPKGGTKDENNVTPACCISKVSSCLIRGQISSFSERGSLNIKIPLAWHSGHEGKSIFSAREVIYNRPFKFIRLVLCPVSSSSVSLEPSFFALAIARSERLLSNSTGFQNLTGNRFAYNGRNGSPHKLKIILSLHIKVLSSDTNGSNSFICH